jgi:hypothetical protein
MEREVIIQKISMMKAGDLKKFLARMEKSEKSEMSEKKESVDKDIGQEGRKRKAEEKEKGSRKREKFGGKEEVALKKEYFSPCDDKLHVYQCNLCGEEFGTPGTLLRTPKIYRHFKADHTELLLDLIKKDTKYHPKGDEGKRMCNLLLNPCMKKRKYGAKMETTPLEDLANKLSSE